MIGLRTEDDVDMGGAAENLGTFGSADAATDREDLRPAGFRARRLQRGQPPELGIDLLGRLLADVAGIEDHHVGLVGFGDETVAERRQKIGHAGRIVDVHLTAIGLDVEPLAQADPFPVAAAHACAPAIEDATAARGDGACSPFAASGGAEPAPSRSRPESAAARPSAMTPWQ